MKSKRFCYIKCVSFCCIRVREKATKSTTTVGYTRKFVLEVNLSPNCENLAETVH